MRWIPTRLHAALDYVAGLVLIVAPWVLGFAEFGGAAVWLPVVIGVAMIGMAMLTNYEYGLVGMISMSTHLTVDFVAGALLAISPWLFGFSEAIWAPHLVLGLMEMAAAVMTETVPTRTPESLPEGRVRA